MSRIAGQFWTRSIFKFLDNHLTLKRFNRNVAWFTSNLYFPKYSLQVVKLIGKRQDHSENDGAASDSEDLEESELDFSLHNHSVRYILKNCPEDHIISKINNCASIHELFNIINSNRSLLKSYHISKAVLVLWDIQVNFYRANNVYIVKPKRLKNASSIVTNYIEQLTSQPDFKNLLRFIELNCSNFDQETLSCIILYLSYIGVGIENPIIQKMIQMFFKNLNENTTLTSLSRVVVTVFNDSSLSPIFLCKDSIPYIEKKLEFCDDANEFKLISMCLTSCNKLLNDKILNEYKRKLEELLNNGVINNTDYQSLLKIIIFLNQACWKETCSDLISKCLMLLKDNLSKINVHEALIISNILFKNQEPASLLNQVQQTNLKMYYQLEDDPVCFLDIHLKLLSSIIKYSRMIHKNDVIKTIKDAIPQLCTQNSLSEIYRILKSSKFENREIFDLFWNKYIKFIEKKENVRNAEYVLNACIRYLNFCLELKYRNKNIEKQLLMHLEFHLETSILTMIPSKMVAATAFVISFSNKKFLLRNMIYKLEGMLPQIKHSDYFLISRGLYAALEITKNPSLDKNDLKFLNEKLNDYVNKTAPKINNVNSALDIVKGSICRSFKNFTMEEEILNIFDNENKIKSCYLNSLVFCLQKRSFLKPQLLEIISKYIINKNQDIMGFNVSKFMYLLYYFGYNPKSLNLLVPAVVDITIRDQERLIGLSYLQILLTLCYFNKLPEFFIKQTFNVKFLDKLDMELKNCKHSEMYPLRVRQNLLQLNRAVCLEYPECNVPWFHQKFVDQQYKNRRISFFQQQFQFNVNQYIMDLVQNQNLIEKDIMTPYGYFVDFVIYVNSERKFTESTASARKLAVLLYKPFNYTKGMIQLKGKEQLKVRHLELLGYEVIGINYSKWNTLLTRDEKIEYLTRLILPKVSDEQNLNSSSIT